MEDCPVGKLYASPRTRCDCGAKVYELHSCRVCGVGFLQGYSQHPSAPTFLYPQGGQAYGEEQLVPLTVALQEPTVLANCRTLYLDTQTGKLSEEQEATVRQEIQYAL